jgi:SAM-dependent methyltransferase
LKIKIIMMLKNEDDLVEPWIKYHAALVGYHNLILLDNGSTSARTLAALQRAARQGAAVNAQFSTAEHFMSRGEMYAGLIKLMDQKQVADFWFPLDCDEFLAIGDPEDIRCDRDSLFAELAPYLRSPHPLMISAGLNNHPLMPGCFKWSPQRKTFFAAGACDYLDHGFHHGRSRQGLEGLQTRIVYIHYHYKPYALLIEHAKAKLAPYTDDFSPGGLLAYGLAKRPAFHCVHHLLTSEDDYYRSFDGTDYVQVPAFVAALAGLGETVPFLEDASARAADQAKVPASIELDARVTAANFNELDYLASNQDVARAVEAGRIPSGAWHFEHHGHAESRRMRRVSLIDRVRAHKMAKIAPILRADMTFERNGLKYNFLTPALIEQTKIVDTQSVSQNGYDGYALDLIAAYPDGLVLDCGAGRRPVYFANVINYEIVDYDTTDVLGVGEVLPFADGSIDAVISVAVLEHVRDPFACAAEIVRVLKPGGRLLCCVPFLQPEHGYPHHYFNMAPQGLRSLFDGPLEIDDHKVIASILPVWSLRWIVRAWAEGLQGEARAAFGALTFDSLLDMPQAELPNQIWVKDLSERKNFELASATLLFAHKPPMPASAAKPRKRATPRRRRAAATVADAG